MNTENDVVPNATAIDADPGAGGKPANGTLPGTPADDRACFDLFCRAIEGSDEGAWREILATFEGEVRAWCRRAARGRLLDLDELVSLSWQKFWQHFTVDKLHAAESLPQVLRYLKMCVCSVVADASRAQPVMAPLDQYVMDLVDRGISIDEACADSTARAAFWRLIDDCLRDELERLLIHQRFELGLKYAEMQTAHPDRYPSVDELYVIARQAMDRLRRSGALRAWREESRP